MQTWRQVLVVSVLVLAAGCSRSAGPDSSSAASAARTEAGAAPASAASAGTPAVSALDAGPRAGDSPANEALAEQGERLFKDKGCSACHTFGRKLTGPDLAGVSRRRTARWIESQILDPSRMTKEDPISHQLLGQFMLQMPNQGLTPDQARAVVEYFKHRDHETDSN
jgi:mono/diheme cytochrome c family protein